MFKQVFQYEDIDGEEVTRTAYFHLTQLELSKDMELEVLQARFEKFQREVMEDKERDMTPAEVREMYRMIEVLVRASYGVRYGEGDKLFDKNPVRWKEFEDSGAYDGFMRWLFEEPSRANYWMENIWPKQLRDVAKDALAQNGVATVTEIGKSAPGEVANESKWEFMADVKEYDLDYLEKCSDEEFQAIVDHFKDGRNVPFELLVAGGKRMNGGTAE